MLGRFASGSRIFGDREAYRAAVSFFRRGLVDEPARHALVHGERPHAVDADPGHAGEAAYGHCVPFGMSVPSGRRRSGLYQVVGSLAGSMNLRSTLQRATS